MTIDAVAVASQQRLMVRVARMYHERGLRQPEIAEQLHVSQAKVSRLLKRAGELGIVRVTVHEPLGGNSDIEEKLAARYHLADVVVADVNTEDEAGILTSIGVAAGTYLGETLLGHERIGISSWSSTLLAMVGSMQRHGRPVADAVVQVLGGVGEPTAQVEATRLTEQFALITGATPQYLTTPGFVSSPQLRDALLTDPYVREIQQTWTTLTIVLAGIGSLDPSPLLRQSGNALSDDDRAELRAKGAVGDTCLHFFDASGRPVHSDIDKRVVGISAETLLAVPRRVGVAGGERKHEAIRGALLGGWVNVLVTDTATAHALLT